MNYSVIKLIIKVDDELDGKATQVRVVQGREPRHFIKMFGGKMVVFSGGKASGFRHGLHFQFSKEDQEGNLKLNSFRNRRYFC